mgnify:CR=1 FL=1
MHPESYVVRVYRRVKGDPNAVVGVVEAPESRRQARFQDLAELAGILAAPARHLRRPGAAARAVLQPPPVKARKGETT